MKLYFSIILFLLCICGISQKNLVRNFSFEDSVICAYSDSFSLNYPLPKPWVAPTKKSLNNMNLNSCSSLFCCGVPYNTPNDTSFQYPKTGNGYSSFVSSLFSNANYNSRSYVQQKLRDSLIPSKAYYIDFFVNLPNSMSAANNNISLLISKNEVYSDTVNYTNGLRLINADAQIFNYGNPVITDTVNWVKVSGIYNAIGGEKFITIGNFKDDANTQIIKFNSRGGMNQVLYYLDDVSVIPLDSMCLKADAGVDKSIALGDSTFIGSYTNGISNIMWLQNGNLKIDSTKPGFFVKPTASTFYVVQQTVNGCFSSDTVFVNVGTTASNNLLLKATLNKNIVQCKWNGINDNNMKAYNLKRKINNETFNTISIVEQNNANEFIVYDSLKSSNKNQTINYQLEIVYKDGKTSLSNIASLLYNENNFNKVTIYPNPAKNEITISS